MTRATIRPPTPSPPINAAGCVCQAPRWTSAPWKANRPVTFSHPVGCLECRMTGYRGRVGVYEILLLSQDIKQAISDDADVAKIRDLAYREGMKPLRISGAMKIAAGMTTLAEVFKVAPPSERP